MASMIEESQKEYEALKGRFKTYGEFEYYLLTGGLPVSRAFVYLQRMRNEMSELPIRHESKPIKSEKCENKHTTELSEEKKRSIIFSDAVNETLRMFEEKGFAKGEVKRFMERLQQEIEWNEEREKNSVPFHIVRGK